MTPEQWDAIHREFGALPAVPIRACRWCGRMRRQDGTACKEQRRFGGVCGRYDNLAVQEELDRIARAADHRDVLAEEERIA